MTGVWRAWTTSLWLLLQSQHLGRSRLQSVHRINQTQAYPKPWQEWASSPAVGRASWLNWIEGRRWGQQVSITLLKNLDWKENLKNQLEADVKINLSSKCLPRLFWTYSLPLSLHVLSQLWPHVAGSEMSWCLIYISLAIAWQKSLADGKVMIGQTDRIFHLREIECEAHFVDAERGQLSHELAPELLLGHQHRAVWNH